MQTVGLFAQTVHTQCRDELVKGGVGDNRGAHVEVAERCASGAATQT